MSEPAIELKQAGKMYKLYRSPADKARDLLGLSGKLFWKKSVYEEFWALRGIDLRLQPGQRIGVVGRNGAGKSTLLKLVCGNLAVTEGTCVVRGEVEALLDAGTGFHQDFTGRQNIRSSMVYRGLPTEAIDPIEKEIIEFTELGPFIDQPVKTYSLGMHARLAFAVATAVQPELLIIDEVLGAGDAYFATKCAGRMHELVSDGKTTVLLVSHATEQILRYCDECLWLERGRIMMEGPTNDVVKAYQAFIHNMEDRKLKAKNFRRAQGEASPDALDRIADTMRVRFTPGPDAGPLELSQVALYRGEELEEELGVGGVQDGDASHATWVDLTGGAWRDARNEQGVFFRRLDGASGDVVLVAYGLVRDAPHRLVLRYRGEGGVRVLLNDEDLAGPAALPDSGSRWRDEELAFTPSSESHALHIHEPAPETEASRWRGSGEVKVGAARLLNAAGQEQTVVRPGETVKLEIDLCGGGIERLPVIPCAVIYRMDGVLVSNNQGASFDVDFSKNSRKTISVCYPGLNLGDGSYLVSLGLYRTLEAHGETECYDIVDKILEFKVVGNAPFNNGVFRHPAEWSSHE